MGRAGSGSDVPSRCCCLCPAADQSHPSPTPGTRRFFNGVGGELTRPRVRGPGVKREPGVQRAPSKQLASLSLQENAAASGDGAFVPPRQHRQRLCLRWCLVTGTERGREAPCVGVVGRQARHCQAGCPFGAGAGRVLRKTAWSAWERAWHSPPRVTPRAWPPEVSPPGPLELA